MNAASQNRFMSLMMMLRSCDHDRLSVEQLEEAAYACFEQIPPDRLRWLLDRGYSFLHQRELDHGRS